MSSVTVPARVVFVYFRCGFTVEYNTYLYRRHSSNHSVNLNVLIRSNKKPASSVFSCMKKYPLISNGFSSNATLFLSDRL